MDLNTIQSDGRWGDVSACLNANFEKIRLELMKLRHASILTFCKGYFSTESRFLRLFPSGKTGEYAFVGSPWPGTVYEWADTSWVNSKVSPQLGEAIFIEMLKRHIDNETIYWDSDGAVIKSAGGGDKPEDTFTIEVGINAANVGQCAVEAEGAVSVVSDAAGALWTVRARKGSTVTVAVVPEAGYQVQKLNVDTVSQEAVSEYTFENIGADHTMYVWMEVEAEEAPADFLSRSDKPGTLYSSTHVALNAIKEDYPDGLTQDVTLTCIKKAKERRIANDENKAMNERICLSVLKDFNKGSMYVLAIDGAGLLTYNCASLGGLKFTNVDNVLVRNVAFTNFCNYIEGSTPDEVAALMSIGGTDDYNRNLHVDNCAFDGKSTLNNTTCASYTVSTKYTENVHFHSCTFTGNAGLTFNMVNSRLAVFTRNRISGTFRSGAVAHAGLFNVTNGYRLMLEDNNLDGSTFRESLMYLSGIDGISMKRNYIHDGTRIMEMSSNTSIKKLEVESNLIVNMMMPPVFSWIQELFSTTTDLDELRLTNNTFWMGGGNYIQFIVRYTANDVRKAYIYNNIVVDPDPSATSGKVRLYLFSTLGELNSGYNLYKMSIKNPATGQTYGCIVTVQNSTGKDDSITISGGRDYNLSELIKSGYEVGTRLIGKAEKLLRVENGEATYAITPAQDGLYPAKSERVPDMDYEYKLRSASTNSIGCYNLHGTAVDELSDSTTGYTGEDLTSATAFDSSAQYTAIADSVLLLSHDTLNRDRIVRFRVVGTQHRSLAVGRYALAHMHPVTDADGEYLEDELYTVNIE